jgi:hypothetical protein
MEDEPIGAPEDEAFAELIRRYGKDTADLIRRTEQALARSREAIEDTLRILDEAKTLWPDLMRPRNTGGPDPRD